MKNSRLKSLKNLCECYMRTQDDDFKRYIALEILDAYKSGELSETKECPALEVNKPITLESVMKDMIDNGSVYRINDYKLCIVYSQYYNCFLWCDEYGIAVEEHSHDLSYKKVIFSPKLLGTYTKIS